MKTGSALKSSSAAAMDYEGNESTPARDISLHVCTGQSMASSPGTPLSLHLSLPLLISSFLSFTECLQLLKFSPSSFPQLHAKI